MGEDHSPRKLALGLLKEWQSTDKHADLLLAELDCRSSLTGADRALLHALVLGVLRNAALLDHWIEHLRGRGRLRDPARWLLRLGLFQLMIMDLPPHAAVNETVRLAGRERGLVNAVLRRASRERDELEKMALRAPLEVRSSLPAFLLRRWEQQFGAIEAERLALWSAQPAPVYLRFNALQAVAASFRPDGGDGQLHEVRVPFAERLGAAAEQVKFFQPERLPRDWLDAGVVYAQDPSTAVAPLLLAPRDGERILDACAAPGGKSALLAQLMGNQGTLVTADRAGSRLDRLKANLERLGVTCAEVREVNWLEPPSGEWPLFDGILLDVPCSNTGVMRRRVDVRWRIDQREIARAVLLQQRILSNVLPLLKPSGRLVYSTCSLEPEENEQQVDWLRATFPELSVRETLKVLPHVHGFDGSFAALLERKAAL